MSPRFLAVKTVISRSFARIHEANLKKQGILPLTFADSRDYEGIEEFDQISIVGLARLKPRALLKGIVTKKDGSTVEIELSHTLTDAHIKWFKAGTALNLVREEG
jgi:aconitate hydratase